MIKLREIFTIIGLTFCLTTSAQTRPGNSKTNSNRIPFKPKDTTYWVDNFRQFREALFKRDKTKAKEFLDFPFKNEGNEIWYLAYSDNEKAIAKLDSIVKPFSEQDFDKYFNNIFPDHLIKCLLKIKTDELFRKGKSESPVLKDSSTTYKLYTTYNKTVRQITLNLATSTAYKTSGTAYEKEESNIIYQFEILEDGHIKLKKLLIAD